MLMSIVLLILKKMEISMKSKENGLGIKLN